MAFRLFLVFALFFGAFGLGTFAALGRRDVLGNVVDSPSAFVWHVLCAVCLVVVAGAGIIWSRD